MKRLLWPVILLGAMLLASSGCFLTDLVSRVVSPGDSEALIKVELPTPNRPTLYPTRTLQPTLAPTRTAAPAAATRDPRFQLELSDDVVHGDIVHRAGHGEVRLRVIHFDLHSRSILLQDIRELVLIAVQVEQAAIHVDDRGGDGRQEPGPHRVDLHTRLHKHPAGHVNDVAARGDAGGPRPCQL